MELRITIATVRNLGISPCPCCLVKKDKLHNLGMSLDRKTRVRKRRQDNEERRNLVNQVFDEIHKAYAAVDGTKVDGKLKEQSLIAVKVRSPAIREPNLIKIHHV